MKRLTKERIYMLNQAATGRTRISQKLDQTIIDLFDWLADAIEPNFDIEYDDHDIRLVRDHLDGNTYWLLDGRYINVKVPFGNEINVATPMRRRISKEQALWLATRLSDIFSKIEKKVQNEAERCKEALKMIKRGCENETH